MHRMLITLLAGCGPGGDEASSTTVDTGGDSGHEVVSCGDGVVEGTERCDAGEDNGATTCGCQLGCEWADEGTPCEDEDPCTKDDACDGGGTCVPGPPPDCDDEDPCTEDRCDPSTGLCLNEEWSGTGPELYDMAALTDPSTLDLVVVASTTEWEGITPIAVDEVRYTSYEYDDCELLPVRIEAFIAYPTGVAAAPGLVVAHGLGGYAKSTSASGPAADWGMVTLAYSGPGQGNSEGTGCTSDHLFDTVPFPGDSWFWEHSAAAIRAVTVLETLADVDPDRLGMIGFSGGAVATYMANGVDERLRAVAPISATGHLDLAIAAEPVPGWEFDLLQDMSPPRDPTSEEWLAYVATLDPKNFLPTAHGSTLVLNGAQDQFFPIDSSTATFEDLYAASSDARMLLIKDFDHGYYASLNGDEAEEKIDAALGWWLLGRLGRDPGLEPSPAVPLITDIQEWTCLYGGTIPYGCTLVVVDLGSPPYEVDEVELHFSVDNALTFASWDLQEHDSGVWFAEVEVLDWRVYNDDNLVYFVEATYSTGWFGPDFGLSSTPHLPPGFSPNLIAME